MSPNLKPGELLRALTFWPEWVWAIRHLDKRVENRGWALPVGIWFGLHAGKHVGGRPGAIATRDGWAGVQHMARAAGWTALQVQESPRRSWTVWLKGSRRVVQEEVPLVTSAMVGLFRVTTVHRSPMGRVVDGWHVPFEFGNVFEYVPLVRPVPCQGKQGLWVVPEAVRNQMEVKG